jgi:diaminopimelate epimerase
MQGAGNDFVVVNGLTEKIALTPEQIRYIADRHFGIGCDQLLMVERPASPSADFRYRIFNADGNEVEQCGNGARCFLRYLRDQGLTSKSEIIAETLAGEITLRFKADDRVAVDMGRPRFEPREVPFDAPERANVYDLVIDGATVPIMVLSMGNPHAVQIVSDITTAPVVTQGSRIESHPRFPKHVNAGYMQIIDRSHIRLRVYERGAGETLACGSGACAAVVAGRVNGLLDECVDVALPGGDLKVCWQGKEQAVWLTGPAETVFEGNIEL